MCIRNLWRRVDVQITFSGEALHEVVQQLGELRLRFLIAITSQGLEHFGGELAALDQRVEDCFLERLERPVGVTTKVPPIGV